MSALSFLFFTFLRRRWTGYFFLKEWQVFFSHLNFWTSNMACYTADCGHVVDVIYWFVWIFQRAVEKTMPFLRSIKGVISYILLLLLLKKKFPWGPLIIFAPTIVKIQFLVTVFTSSCWSSTLKRVFWL